VAQEGCTALPIHCCIFEGEILTDNWMPVKAGTNSKQLSGAIAARIRQSGHTVLECYGSAAVTTAIQVCVRTPFALGAAVLKSL
jgi:hypothetical protein